MTVDPLNEPVATGTSTFDLPLGPIRVRIVDLPTPLDPFVSDNYSPFVEPADPGVHVDLTVECRSGEGEILPAPPPGEMPVVDLEQTGPGAFDLRSHWQDGSFDLSAGTGQIVLTDRRLARFRMSLENYLRVACQLMLSDRGGFLLHSAGIVDRGRCHLFFGHSGAGKSTTTALSLPRKVLSDDMVLVDATGDQVVAHAVPFFGAFPMKQRVRGKFPVAAAFRLRQATEDRLERLPNARAAATLGASIPFIHDLGLRHEGLMDLVARTCRMLPLYDMHFTRSARFWDLIHETLPG